MVIVMLPTRAETSYGMLGSWTGNHVTLVSISLIMVTVTLLIIYQTSLGVQVNKAGLTVLVENTKTTTGLVTLQTKVETFFGAQAKSLIQNASKSD